MKQNGKNEKNKMKKMKNKEKDEILESQWCVRARENP